MSDPPPTNIVFSPSDDYEKSSSETAKFLKQPRTLSLAIVPGEHIVSIALAKELEQTTPTIRTDKSSPL